MAKTVYPQKPRRNQIRQELERENIEEKKLGPPKPPAKKGPELRDQNNKLIRALAGASVPPNRKSRS